MPRSHLPTQHGLTQPCGLHQDGRSEHSHPSFSWGEENAPLWAPYGDPWEIGDHHEVAPPPHSLVVDMLGFGMRWGQRGHPAAPWSPAQALSRRAGGTAHHASGQQHASQGTPSTAPGLAVTPLSSLWPHGHAGQGEDPQDRMFSECPNTMAMGSPITLAAMVPSEPAKPLCHTYSLQSSGARLVTGMSTALLQWWTCRGWRRDGDSGGTTSRGWHSWHVLP